MVLRAPIAQRFHWELSGMGSKARMDGDVSWQKPGTDSIQALKATVPPQTYSLHQGRDISTAVPENSSFTHWNVALWIWGQTSCYQFGKCKAICFFFLPWVFVFAKKDTRGKLSHSKTVWGQDESSANSTLPFIFWEKSIILLLPYCSIYEC